jgi:hypothetical protein
VVGRISAIHNLATGGVVKADHAAVDRRLTPAHVPPNASVAVVEHAREIVGISSARSLKARPGVGARPSDTTIGRAVHDILAEGETAAALVHRRYVNTATALQVTGDLNIADEGSIELHRRPSGAVIRVRDVQCAAPHTDVVVRDVHSPVEGTGCVVIHPHTLAIIIGAVVRARASGPGDAIR